MSPFIIESARQLPVAAEADVVVCGGGFGGVSAAVAAARAGATVVILEEQGHLGGVWTSCLLNWNTAAAGRTGIMTEIMRELDCRGARTLNVARERDAAYDPEQMKLVLEEMTATAGVRVQLLTRVCAVRAGDAGGAEAVVTESASGRQAWRGGVVIDATGDGEVAAMAGGRRDDETARTVCMPALVSGVRAAGIADFVDDGSPAPAERLRRELQRAGIDQRGMPPRLTRIRDDLFALAVDYPDDLDPSDAARVTAAMFNARAGVHLCVSALRSLGAPWRGLRIVSTASRLAVRGGIGERFAVTGAGLRVSTTGEGMLLAGRCAVDDTACSEGHVSGGVAALGQLAGVAAVLCARTGRNPRELQADELAAEFAGPAHTPAGAPV